MPILVADVGGTNARLALAADGVLQLSSVSRFRGQDHASFAQVLRLYLESQGNPALTAACIAVAGPVACGRARLTNRDWDFSQAALCTITGAGRALLMNDMIALGHAVSSSTADGIRVLRPGASDAPGNGQKLVVNAGTGFNICALKLAPGHTAHCLEAEEGHASLPLAVWQLLAESPIPPARLALFSTNESLFSGRGLARLHQALHATAPCRAETVVAAAEAGDPAARRTTDLYAELFGLLCRDLALRFMPRDGLYLAGSVARSVVRRPDRFLQAFATRPQGVGIAPDLPLAVMESDLAALQGCLSAAMRPADPSNADAIHSHG